MRVKGLISKNTIVLHPTEGTPININKENNLLLFEEVKEVINSGDLDGLVEKFLDIKHKIERYSLNLFTVDKGADKMYLKGDDEPMPELMVDKLLELNRAGEDFMPLIRFWKKLKTNPSSQSIEQLYGFMVHNGIGLTETGDIVVEKGVSVRNNMLVDSFTETIDNSIGAVVSMDRDKVDPDPTETCSFGLHVGAPEYVRDYYNTGVIVKCTVNPKDVVAVPTDYDNTKMRVCEYKVVGYSDINETERPVYRLEDFVTETSRNIVQNEDYSIEDVDNTTDYEKEAEEQLTDLTAKQILEYIEDVTGVKMPYSPKSKRTIVKRGIEILTKHIETNA